MNIHRIFIFFMVFILGGHCAWASEQGGMAKAVLMPISTPFSQQENAKLAAKVSADLSGKYQVLYGKEVDSVVKRIFDEENKGLNCDLDICYQKIARHFGVEFIASFNAAKNEKGEVSLSLLMLNVLENKIVLKRKAVCKSQRFEDVLKIVMTLGRES